MRRSRSRPAADARGKRVRAEPSVKANPREPRVSTTMRLRRSLRTELEATAARSRRSVADVAQELLEEALRMRQCPGIYFADEPSGRTAKIGGTGLAVWEVLRGLPAEADLKLVRDTFPQLSQAQLTSAMMYYRRYPEEIQREIDANAALTPEVIDKRYPGLVRFVTAE